MSSSSPAPRPLKALAAVAFAFAVSAAPVGAQTPGTPALPVLKPTWDLSTLFASDEAWDAERRALLAELPALRALREGFGRDAASLRSAMDRLSDAQRRFSRAWVYASAHGSTDNRDARNQERQALMRAAGGQYGAATSWVPGAIRELGAERVESFLRADAGLAKHAVRLRDVLRQARHQLHPEAEAALAALSPALNSAANTRSLLVNADIPWPELTIAGKTERVSDTVFARLREHPDRAVREQVFKAFFATYGRYTNTLGTTLAQRVEQGVINARLRGHASAVAASLADNDIPESVYRTLVAEAGRGLPTLHRYFRLRQRLLGLPDLAYHDVYPDMVASPRKFPLAETAALTLASVAPLGADYQGLLAQAYAAGTMHVYPAEGKSSGAYQSGIYGQTPLIFLNHQDTFGSASTFTHEWGHGMHTILANRTQPFETARYPLFIAEIAAFTHELLLQEHMLKNAATREERLFFLGEALERLRGAFFRQAMFAEFELATHDAVQRGEALTGRRMTQLYCELLGRYHGQSEGVMKIDPVVCSEWAYIPHFYRPFYVYQYATSMAAANHFAQRIAGGDRRERENYLDVLRAGGSMHPVPLLQRAGLDMRSPEPYRALVARMDALLDEMERLLAQ
ncbi:MAG: oligoendopeptidase F family protein [Rubrivivax sp.]|nr:oligoendopeptidase F family protein [Rubrivivax sp.]